MAKHYRAVLFDLDGTLFDTAGEIAAAGNAMLIDMGLPAVSLHQSTQFVGQGASHYVKAALTFSQVRLSEALTEVAVDTFLRHYQSFTGTLATPYPEVLTTLQTIHQSGMQMAVVTNKQTDLAARLLKQFEVDRLFQLVLGGDAMVHKKPHPWSVLRACHHLGVQTEESVFIGDSDNDVQAAKAAQVPVWVVPYGYSGNKQVQELAADRVLTGFGEIVGLFKN